MSRRHRERRVLVTIGLVALVALLSPLTAAADVPATELVPGTAVLLNQSGVNPGGGGAGSTTGGATIFSPAAYVDYKRFGGEPTALVDRYPFPGAADTSRVPAAKCPPGLTTCYKDLVYVSSPEGVGYPGFSFFWKSTTIGQTFRLPPHDPIGTTLTLAGGAAPVNPLPAIGAADTTPTACPDPADPRLQIAGPVVADKSPASPYAHRLYIPFIRGGDSQGAPPYELWVARSDDLGATWTRSRVAAVGYDNPANIFPQLTIDTGANLYYTWSQTQGDARNPDLGGETDVYYTYSTDGGATWAAPIDLTPQTGDSAVFAWLVAGDPGRVDLVYYGSNSGLNPNAAGVDGNGAPCDPGAAGCQPNPAVWNVYFAQSLNALNPGASFASVRIGDHPNHVGQVCTVGLACETGNGNRRLLDFFTVDVDHIGAANVAWADDKHPFGTHNK